MDLLYQIVRRLFRDNDVSFSRNRNFAAYDDPLVRRAVRTYKHLRSVEQALLAEEHQRASIDSITEEEGQIIIKLSFENGRRESYLTTMDWTLLVENDAIKERLLEEYALLEEELIAF